MLFRAAVLVALAVSAYGACPPVPAGACNVCGEGKCVSKPEAIFEGTPCGVIQEDGFRNFGNSIGEVIGCGISQGLIADVCGCDAVGAPDTPAPVKSPTKAPANKPTKTATGGKKPKATKKAGKKRALREAADTAH